MSRELWDRRQKAKMEGAKAREELYATLRALRQLRDDGKMTEEAYQNRARDLRFRLAMPRPCHIKATK